jgi:hypothetical protein
MKKCVLGEGDTGEYIFQDNLLTTDMIDQLTGVGKRRNLRLVTI